MAFALENLPVTYSIALQNDVGAIVNDLVARPQLLKVENEIRKLRWPSSKKIRLGLLYSTAK